MGLPNGRWLNRVGRQCGHVVEQVSDQALEEVFDQVLEQALNQILDRVSDQVFGPSARSST